MFKSKVTATREHIIQNAIADWLGYKGWFVWRNNSGVIRTISGSYVHMGMAGLPDLFALKNGTLLGVEVKRPGKKPTDIQEQMLAALRLNGALAIVATSTEDVDAYLKSLDRKDLPYDAMA